MDPVGNIVLLSREEKVKYKALHHVPSEDVMEELDKKHPRRQSRNVIPVSRKLSPTEQRNEKSSNLSSMTIHESIELMVEEESQALRTILTQTHRLEELIGRMSSSLCQGGRVFYVGAGTSGRLGVMDAIECHSTFSTPVNSIQGIIAGSIRALHEPLDCAEETFEDGVSALTTKEITCKDVTIGISASGQTPFVWGALYQARIKEAFVGLITFNPFLEFDELQPDLTIAFDVGPEVLTGSTRLKCGTTTKTILNMLSTLTMVKIGKCYQNLMVDMKASNSKLRGRSVRIIGSLLPGVSDEVIREELLKNDFDIKQSVQSLIRRNLDDKNNQLSKNILSERV